MKRKPASQDVAIRPLVQEDTAAILRAILAAGDYGILLTDLEHKSLACNRQFGKIFGVDPSRVVEYGVDELRDRVLPFIPNPDAWLERLDEIYADPEREYEDDLTLLKKQPLVVHRFSGPVRNAQGHLIGRLWTFRDITARKRSERIGEILHELSAFHDPDPRIVTRRVLETVSGFYKSTAILSIRQGDFLEFREVSGPPSILHKIKGNKLRNSYCRVALQSLRPLLVQDARSDPEFSNSPPRWAGYTRYLGAPVFGSQGRPVGTICMIDKRSSEKLDEEDLRFISLLAMRVSAELAREQFIRERISEQEEALRKEHEDLELTRQVLNAMNQSIKLLGEPETGSLIDSQLKLTRGVLNYESAAILILEGERVSTSYISSRSTRIKHSALARSEVVPFARVMEGPNREWVATDGTSTTFGERLSSRYLLGVPLTVDGRIFGLLVLGRSEPPELDDSRHLTLLQALVEQINLVVGAHVLQARLTETNEELKDARRQLVESEKLSAVGTLAAATAHDIRNILSSLSFEVTANQEDPKKALNAVKDQLDRFTVLAHRLLSYARPRLIARQSVDLRDVIEKVIGLTAAHAKLGSVDVVNALPETVPMVMGEPHQLEHLFVNLILNAIQAMEPIGGCLTFRSLRKNGSIVVEVGDTGRGIAPEDLPNLFRPFHSRRSEGFGLGLYSCKRIVEEHEGTISVSSQLGQGTTFTIALPCKIENGGELPHGRAATARR